MQKIEIKELFSQICISIEFWVESENRYVSLTVSAKGMRTIDKNGIDKVLADLRSRGTKI